MEKIRGVNLGGWLVLERWMTPSLFDGLLARDETQFCEELGEKARDVLETHRKTWITEDDIVWLKDHGITALRVPLPHWMFGNTAPYVGCLKYVDWIMDIALKHKVSVLLDLHTAPGSQNGKDHSGLSGGVEWHKEPGNITQTLDVIEQLAERYCKYPNLLAIELLNEPINSLPRDVLTEYFRVGYERIRKYCDPSIGVVISDYFNPLDWKDVLVGDQYENVWQDTHMYQCFSEADKRVGVVGNIKKAKNEWSETLVTVQATRPVIVGEWSLALDGRAFRGMDEYERDRAVQAYGQAQIQAFQQAQGWFFWSYKTEEGGAWSLRDSITRGWLRVDDIPS